MSEIIPPQFSPRDAAVLTWMHDFAPYGVLTTDKQLRVRSWNRWMEVQSGVPAPAAVGHTLFELFPDLDADRLRGYFERALLGEVSVLSTALHAYLLPFPSALGAPIFEHMQQTGWVAPLRFESEITGTIVVIEDVTQREVQTVILRRQHDRDEILSWALAHLLVSGESRRTIRELFYKVAEHYDFDTYLLYLLEPDEASLRLHAAGGLVPSVEQELAVLPDQSSVRLALLRSPEPIALEHIDLSPNPGALFGVRLPLRACAVLPLRTPHGLLGALCFGSCSRGAFESGELDLLSTIAQYVAVALTKQAMDFELRTAQTKLNQHAQDLERQVTERTARLHEIIAELETFTYTVAHDLRAPIRALKGYCEVLRDDYLSQIPGEPMAIIHRLASACERLDTLTHDLLAFYKISSHDIALASTPVEEVLAEVLSLLPASQTRYLVVQAPLDWVVAQRALLKQCLLNLIDNALKFVAPGAVPRIVIRTERAESLSAVDAVHHLPFTPAHYGKGGQTDLLRPPPDPGSHWVKVIVDDNGIGVPPAICRKVFGIFERGTNSSEYQGTGIGLAIVARAMQRMGGFCGVESIVSGGSRFWLAFPAGAPAGPG